MVSIAGPRRTARPRQSSASTAKGSTASSAPSWEDVMLWRTPSVRGTARPSGGGPERDPSRVERAETPGQNALLRVQAVLGLVEDHGARAVHDLVRHLLARVGGQAVHEDRV